jgi:hypothetical protein
MEVETDVDRLRAVEDAYQAAKCEYDEAAIAARRYQVANRTPSPMFFVDGKCFVPVNRAQRCDSVLDRLQNAAEKARQRFMDAMDARAKMRKLVGLTK